MGKARIFSGAINEPLDIHVTTAEGATEGGVIVSAPPTTKCRVTNLYVDPDTGKLVIEYDDIPM